MHPERFRGPDISSVAGKARRTFGDDVMILHTRSVREDGVPLVEVLAAPASAVDRLRARLAPQPLPREIRRADGSPFLVALVGPTGAGKTTTAAKLAIRDDVFGSARCGLLTIDTYRVGGMEQLATYAELAGIPFEVVFEVPEVKPALERLSACDVVIVDTPGRSPASVELNERWRALLDALDPDEIHLVLPANLRADLASDVARAYGPTRGHSGVTHLLITKLDEVPRQAGVADMALSVGMPLRWTTDGQDVPTALGEGMPRILRAYGLSPELEPDWVTA